MNTQTIEKNWAELKGMIKTKWGKFNDEEIETLKGDLSQLAGKIEKSYGIAKEHADRQYEDFKSSVNVLIGAAPAAGVTQFGPADKNSKSQAV
jgi:uncharacterized protein YjbJ (UPF0337 family)